MILAAEVGMLLSYMKQKHLNIQLSQTYYAKFLSRKSIAWPCCPETRDRFTETQYTLIVPIKYRNESLPSNMQIRLYTLGH